MPEEMTVVENNSKSSKENHIKKKKRKFIQTLDENGLNSPFATPRMSKKPCITKSSEQDIPKFLHYKNTNDYTKVVAEPSLLPSTPKIFKTSKLENGSINTSDSFLFNLLASNSFNTNKNERFSQLENNSNNKKSKNKEEKKKKKVKKETKKEEVVEEMVEISPKIKEKKEKNKKVEKEKFEPKLEQSYCESGNRIMKESENMAHKIHIYRVPQKEALIFHMIHPSKFSFQGELKITIIAGEVEILGYSLNSLSSKSSVNIYSPNFCTPLVVETKETKQTKPMEEVLLKLKENMTENDYNKCCENLKPDDSVLFVELQRSSFGNVINKYSDMAVFPKDLEEFFLMTKTLKSIQSIFNFNFSSWGKYYRKSSQWDKIPLGQCTVLCGGKGVGKSTLLKYYLNKFIALEEKVLCLDFDPGQPEFSFPGCVSAVIVDEPLIGPNFTHVKDPILMMNFGDVDVTPNPTKYLECVKYIIDYCKKNEDLLKMKWFVNTMGFCKGLGVSLMISILKLLEPNTVIQIKCSDSKNNYPFYLTPVTLNSTSGFRSMPLEDVELSYDLRVIYSCAELNKKQIKGGLKQREIRDIMAISYFSKAVSPPFYNFNAVRPYLISFSKLYLGIEFYIDPNEVLKAFNGNTVSLSHFEPDTEEIFSVESEEDAYYKVVINPRISPSLGIGFVRGIDCKEKKFYIITHLPLETLEKVNCLNLRKISAPHSMFLKQESVEGRKLYITSGTTDTVHRVKRMFRVPEYSFIK